MEEPLSEEVLIQLSLDYAQVDKATEALRKQMMKIHGEYGALEERLNSFIGSFAKTMGNKTLPIQAAFVKTWDKAYDGINGVIEAMRTMASSSGLAANQFSALNDSIQQAAAETGNEFKDVATGARNLFDFTGLKEGLAEAVLDAERMNKTFGSSRESFGKLAAKFTQFAEGAGTANDLMMAFNKTTGITGSRLDAVLDHMTEIGNKLRNIAGGGSKFATSMKANTEFTSKMAAKFAEMGGDPQAFMDIQSAILDPNKWDEIGQKMPGMAKYFVQMQDAMVKGDIDSFAKFLKEGAVDTAAMGKSMSTLARSAVGMDFTSVEILSKMNWSSLKNDGLAAGSVLERSAKQIRGLGEQIGIFFTNLAAAIMPVLSPIIEWVSSGLSALNSFMAAMQGPAMSAVVSIGMLTVAILTAWKLWQRIMFTMPKTIEPAADAVGKTLGKAVEGVSTGIANGLSNFVNILAKNAVQLLAVGAGFMLMGAGLWMMADAIVNVGKLSLGDVAVGLLALSGAVLIFSLAAMALGTVAMTPMFWLGILAITSLGIAMGLFGSAVLAMGTGIKSASEGIKSIVALAPGLATLAAIDLTGLTRLGDAVKAFNVSTTGATVSNNVLDSIKGVVDTVSKLGSSITDIVFAGDMATKYGPQIKAAVNIITDQLAEAVATLNDKLVHFFGNTTISKNVQESLNFVVDLFAKIPDALFQMAAFGTIMEQNGATLSASMKTGIDSVITIAVSTMEALKKGLPNVDATRIDTMKKAFDALSGMVDPMFEVSVAGRLFASTEFGDGIRSYVGNIGFFLRSMLGLYDSVGDAGFAKLTKMPELVGKFRTAMDKDIKLSAKGGAEVALDEHDSVTRDHYAKVEMLLTGILTAVQHGGTPQVVQQSAEHAPSWDPAVLFGGVEEGTF